MSQNAHLQLAVPNTFTQEDYVKHQLVPLVADLNRLVNQLTTPEMLSTDELGDMTPELSRNFFEDVDKVLRPQPPKGIRFGLNLRETPLFKGDKRLKVMLKALVYVAPEGTGVFRLKLGDRGITETELYTSSTTAQEIVKYLPVLDCFKYENNYIVQAKYSGNKCMPICRSISLTPVYI